MHQGSRLSVMHVTINPGGAGAERMAGLIAEALVRDGERSCLVPIDPLPEAFLDERVNISPLTARRLRTPFRELAATVALGVALRESQPDVVHLHCEAPELVGALALQFFRRPMVVVTEHVESPWVHRPLVGRIVRRLLRGRGAQWVLCHQDAGRGLHSTNAVVIPNATRNLPRPPLPKATGGVDRVLLVQRLYPHKRVDLVLEALSEARFAGEVLIIGTGPEERKLRIRSQELDINVSFLGFEPEPWSHLRAGDVLISASEREGEPLTVLEAMSLNVPLLLSDISGHRASSLSSNQLFRDVKELSSKFSALLAGQVSVSSIQPGHLVAGEIADARSAERIGASWVRFYRELLSGLQ